MIGKLTNEKKRNAVVVEIISIFFVFICVFFLSKRDNERTNERKGCLNKMKSRPLNNY